MSVFFPMASEPSVCLFNLRQGLKIKKLYCKKFNYLVLQAGGHQEGGEGPSAEVQEGKRGKKRV